MDGIVYSAIGERYLAEALTSARSSLRFNHVPHRISTDQEVTPAETDPDELSIRTYRPGDDAFAEKIHSMAASPFERSIFLDTDTYVTNYICHVFDLLDKYDMAAAFAPGYRGMKDPEVPTAFYELNTGVIAWRSGERTASFFADWLDTHAQMTRERPFHPLPGSGFEQPAFRRCAWRHELALYVLGPEYNYRPKKPGSVTAQVRVLHGRRMDFEKVAAEVNREDGARAFQSLTARPRER